MDLNDAGTVLVLAGLIAFLFLIASRGFRR